MAHRLLVLPFIALLAQGALAASPARSTQASGSVATASITVGLVGTLVMTPRVPDASLDEAAKDRPVTGL
ncbi:hypothetical protein [Pararhodobacter zhoushanensis]|uniref:hypothetical protein n=1 Tax=Pararhodobacter zhoushanensis TaxID=2479545 RepID=UPI000F8F04B6|nr:hypothetical protein [Pararhodobacter zhoushanensis]